MFKRFLVLLFCSILYISGMNAQSQINWLSWEEATQLNEQTPKKLFVDVYTDWCGWCKKMDKTTFQDPKVVKYLADNFYSIKLDAEMQEEIQWRGQTFNFVKTGRKGVHTLAYSLLNGKMSYPTYVMLNENFDRIAISPGYKQADQIMKELQFAAQEKYKEMTWQQFMGSK